MDALTSPQDIILLLQDMERRSNQLSGDLQDVLWTAIGFRVGNNHYVIGLSDTSEIFPLPEQVTLVPKAQDWVYGIVNLRGELLPVFDLNRFLNQTPTKLSKRSRIMVINHPDVVGGVLVDEVFGLKHFPQQPEMLGYTHNEPAFVTGQISQSDQSWQVFSFANLVSDNRFLNAAA
jgi:twitching motility protein PilI